MARRSLTAANVLAVIFLAAQAGGAAARRGRAALGLVFLAAAAAQGASAQKDACATGAEGRWAGTHARLLALDESKLPNLYQRKLEFENITGASIVIEQKNIKHKNMILYFMHKNYQCYNRITDSQKNG